jgi:ParB-like chromosome segregation protein Spo0J
MAKKAPVKKKTGKKVLPKRVPASAHPISDVIWRDRKTLKPNNYNPNRVAPMELQLLKISILEDGWTQPIVINAKMEIVDGFHRWIVSGHPELMAGDVGMVPTVMINSDNASSQKMATIRHNRARGTHGVLDMAELVRSLIADGLSQQEIERRLQMEAEEVIRLASRAGIPKSDIIQDLTFSKAWVV